MARHELVDVESAALGQANTSSEALFELGLMYATGRSVQTNLISAHKWPCVAIGMPSATAARLPRKCRKPILPRRSALPAIGCSHTDQTQDVGASSTTGVIRLQTRAPVDRGSSGWACYIQRLPTGPAGNASHAVNAAHRGGARSIRPNGLGRGSADRTQRACKEGRSDNLKNRAALMRRCRKPRGAARSLPGAPATARL